MAVAKETTAIELPKLDIQMMEVTLIGDMAEQAWPGAVRRD